MAISKRLRFEVLRRDEHRCRYCGVTADVERITVDHVVPVALGGTTEASNLVAACVPCNSGKTSSVPDQTIVADVDNDQVRWAHAMKIAVERRAARFEADQEWFAWFDAKWSRWTTRSTGLPCPRTSDWRETLVRLRAAGVSDDDLVMAVETTMNKANLDNGDRWRYFCGICWNITKSLVEDAKEIASSTDEQKPAPRWPRDMVGGSLLAAMLRALLRRMGASPDEVHAVLCAASGGVLDAFDAFDAADGQFDWISVGPLADVFFKRVNPVIEPVLDRIDPHPTRS